MKIKKCFIEKSFALKANDFFLINQMKLFLQLLLTILGGSLKKIAKKITIRVPISRNVYTNASIF